MTTREFVDILARDRKINCDGYDLHVYLENEDYMAITCWYGHEMVPILVYADAFSGRAYSALDINVFRGVTDIQDMPSLGEYRTQIWNEIKALVKDQTGVECTEEMRYKSSLEFKKFQYLKRPKKVVREVAEEIIEMFALKKASTAA